jgi:hypothetical protein
MRQSGKSTIVRGGDRAKPFAMACAGKPAIGTKQRPNAVFSHGRICRIIRSVSRRVAPFHTMADVSAFDRVHNSGGDAPGIEMRCDNDVGIHNSSTTHGRPSYIGFDKLKREMSSGRRQIGTIGAAIFGAIIGGNTGNIISQGLNFALWTSREFQSRVSASGGLVRPSNHGPSRLQSDGSRQNVRDFEKQGGGSGPEWLSDHPNPATAKNSLLGKPRTLGSRTPPVEVRRPNSFEFKRS